MLHIRYFFQITFPVLCGYLPMGIAFGILFVQNGFHPAYAFLMALLVYAGAAQFLIVGLLIMGADLFAIAMLTLTVNLRHILYGLSFINKYGKFGCQKIYLIFALSDETYALLTSRERPKNMSEMTFIRGISIFNHFYWVLGCTVGGLIGNSVPFNTFGMEFVVTALFVVLFMEQCKTLDTSYPILIAIAANIMAIFAFGHQDMLMPALIGAIGLLYIRNRLRGDVPYV